MNKIIKHQAYNLTVGQREVDGFVNATALCQAAGKKISHWLTLDTTKAYINALSVDTAITASELVQVKKGGTEQGTWIHPQAAIHLGMWLSPEFSVLVTKWVMAWMTGGKTPSTPPAPQPDQKALPWTPPPLYPNMTEATFKALPAADQDYFMETQQERNERIRRESREIRKRYYY